MKKYFPILTFLMVFFVFLGAQVSFDLVRFKKPESRVIQYQSYQDVFSKVSFRTVDNKKIILSKVRSPLIILNFWASWCAPCLKELPSLIRLRKRFRSEDLLVIGINTDEEKQLEKILKTQDEFGINFPIVADSLGEALSEFQVNAIPLTIFYYKGKVIDISYGAKEFDSPMMIEKLENLLGQSS